MNNGKKKNVCGEILEREFYRLIPDCESGLDVPYSIELSPALLRYRGLKAVKVLFWAGYGKDIIPDETNIINQNEYDSIIQDCKEILKLLVSITKTTKQGAVSS